MKGIYLLLLFLGSQALSQSNSTPLRYQLEWQDNKIRVQLIFFPLNADSTRFTYGNLDYGGQKDILKGVQQMKVEAPARMTMDTANRTFTFFYGSNSPIRISYDVVDTRSETTTRSQLFRPLIMSDYFFVHGFNLFLLPSGITDSSKVRVSIEWKKLPPFPLFYTFEPDNDGSRPSITTVDSIKFRFLTGATDLKVKKFISESGKNYLVIRKGGLDEKIEKDIERYYLSYNKVMRQFWKDSRKINYSLVLQPYLGVNHDISGVSFGNGFIGKYNRPDSLVKGGRLFVLSHEIGHYYLGDVAAFEGEENVGQWFNEGFNDYLTYYTLLDAGLMKPEEFESEFNKLFQSLYTSKIKNTPNDKIFENFWLLGDYAKLPYWRGCVFAFYLDNQISIATKNKASIRNLMLDLKEVVRTQSKKEFSNEEFVNAVSKYLPKEDFKKQFQDFILEGASILFNDSLVMPFMHLELKDQVPAIRLTDKGKFKLHYHFN